MAFIKNAGKPENQVVYSNRIAYGPHQSESGAKGGCQDCGQPAYLTGQAEERAGTGRELMDGAR
ncbi:hypothetical protein ACFOKJ_09410 [Vogesella amnigena]|uniref:Uncharacterized protein n=1 Tax=Vogesella amnigena TaxID=1507449 RepID=A0ABV7TUB2_9NEIS